MNVGESRDLQRNTITALFVVVYSLTLEINRQDSTWRCGFRLVASCLGGSIIYLTDADEGRMLELYIP